MTVPPWMPQVLERARLEASAYFAMHAPPDGEEHRRSAVLMLFGATDGRLDPDVEVVLTERAAHLRSHPGQVSFPGGRIDPTDAGPVDAALREAQEEVGLDPDSVEVVGSLPELFLGPSRNVVTPVLAWWREPHPIGVVDPGEVATVVRVPLGELLDPAHRFTAIHPRGYSAPGFEVRGLFVWGFTAMLLSHTLDLAGLTHPWDSGRRRPVPALP